MKNAVQPLLDFIPKVAKKNWFLRPVAHCIGGG